MTKTAKAAHAAAAPQRTPEEQAALMREFEKHQNARAIRDVSDWMDNLIAAVESNVRDLKRYRADFDRTLADSDSFSTPVDVMSWFINQTQSLPSNLRLDQAPRLAVALAKATAK